MQLNSASFDFVNLSVVHTVGTITCMVLSLYAAQAMWHDSESQRDCRIVRWGRKLGYPLLALSMLWSLDYSHATTWEPWPPTVAMIWAINLIIALRIMALRARQSVIAERGWFRPNGVDERAHTL